MIEVGASYFIEQGFTKAEEYCQRKHDLLNDNSVKVGELINNKKLQLSKVNLEYNKRVVAQ